MVKNLNKSFTSEHRSKKLKTSHQPNERSVQMKKSEESQQANISFFLQPLITEEQITSDGIDQSTLSPLDYLKNQIRIRLCKDVVTYRALELKNFFREPTQEDIESYDVTVIGAVRSRNIETLRTIHSNGKSLHGCNKFGESLIHMACRRGFTDVVKFLVEEAGVNVKIRDDYGRTPLHDACWTTQPHFDLIDLLLLKDPRLLFICDARGFAPFQYTRREHWDRWKLYLRTNMSELCESIRKAFL